MSKDPIGDITRTAERAWEDTVSTVETAANDWKDAFLTRPENYLDELLFGKEKDPKSGVSGAPPLPDRKDVIASILKEQLDALERTRQNRTLTTGPLGATGDAPLASTALFGE